MSAVSYVPPPSVAILAGRRHARRRLRTALITALSLTIVGVIAGDLYVLALRHRTTPVSLDAALDAFRAAEHPALGASVAPSAPVETPAGAGAAPASTPSASSAPSSGVAVPPPGPIVSAADRDSRNSSAAAPTSPFMGPAEGVYTYQTTGGDSISVAGASHSYPSETYATVRRLGGCEWEIRNDVLEEHIDRRVLCGRDAALLQLIQERQVEFYGKRDGMVMRCDPPALLAAEADRPGATSSVVCGDGSTTTRMTRTVLDLDPLPVGGQLVPAIHVLVDGDFSGRADGKAREEIWFARDTGMTLRWERMVDTVADATFGARVRYQENATFVLQSLTPRT